MRDVGGRESVKGAEAGHAKGAEWVGCLGEGSGFSLERMTTALPEVKPSDWDSISLRVAYYYDAGWGVLPNDFDRDPVNWLRFVIAAGYSLSLWSIPASPAGRTGSSPRASMSL